MNMDEYGQLMTTINNSLCFVVRTPESSRPLVKNNIR